ncbi:MAG TPA: type VI secretion system accessory protein TagJ [Candidatus Aquilonibacter sp.]|nr:type VI secretion system accessory protein TagJ [Candidatus Aquilonibacter sp.]
MIAKQLFEQGKVREAIKELTSYLRDHPADASQRTFLFELLCIAGEYGRAEKQLAVLAQGGAETEMGAVLYYSALNAEKLRNETFDKAAFSKHTPVKPVTGTLNGRPFQSLRDADPDLAGRLEVYAAGAYLWIPFEHIESLQMEAPRRLRDTVWAPATIRTGPEFKSTELGEVLVPVIYPFSWKSDNEAAWLGRVTEWSADENGTEYPCGQKTLLMDGEEVPFLEIRAIEFTKQAAAPAAAN